MIKRRHEILKGILDLKIGGCLENAPNRIDIGNNNRVVHEHSVS